MPSLLGNLILYPRRSRDATRVQASGTDRQAPRFAIRDLALVVAVALLLRLCFTLAIGSTYDYDEFVLLLYARDFAHGAVPYHSFLFFHPPGMLVVLRVIEPLTRVWWPLARVLMVLIDTGTAALVYTIGQHVYGRRTGFAAGLLYACHPLALVAAARVGQDVPVTALGMAGLALLVMRPTVRAAVLAGACLGLAIWIKYPALYFVPVYLWAARWRGSVALICAIVTFVLLLLPYYTEWHAIYLQTVNFQRTRWSMSFSERWQSTGLFWLAVNPLALISLRKFRPAWPALGFLLGGIFLFASQVYYHYFVPVAPFAALLGASVAAGFQRNGRRIAVAVAALVTLGWTGLVALGGERPLFVTAARLSQAEETANAIRASTATGSAVLADRFEYAYLADRPAVLHYFWNVGVLVDAKYLERNLAGTQLVVLSSGASSGFPAGFTAYLDARYARWTAGETTIWRITSPRTP